MPVARSLWQNEANRVADHKPSEAPLRARCPADVANTFLPSEMNACLAVPKRSRSDPTDPFVGPVWSLTAHGTLPYVPCAYHA